MIDNERHRAYLEALMPEVARFWLEYPRVKTDWLLRDTFPAWIPGQYCNTEGCGSSAGLKRDGYWCRWSAGCRFRYRAHLLTRQEGTCPVCAEPLPVDLNTRIAEVLPYSGIQVLAKPAVHEDHVIPRSRGGPDSDWNTQLLHVGCNYSKGSKLTAAAYAVAAEHEWIILDFVPVRAAGEGGLVHLLRPPYRKADGHLRALQARALCNLQVWQGSEVRDEAGKPWNATCARCVAVRERLGAGTGPGLPGLPY